MLKNTIHDNIPMVGCHKKDIAFLLALVEYLSNGFVCSRNALDSRLVHTSMANHIWWSKVVHQELVLALANPLA